MYVEYAATLFLSFFPPLRCLLPLLLPFLPPTSLPSSLPPSLPPFLPPFLPSSLLSFLPPSHALTLSPSHPLTHPPTLSPQALKAIALLRLGRQDEANPLIDGIMKARPGDQATLQAVTMFFRETGESESLAVVLHQRRE